MERLPLFWKFFCYFNPAAEGVFAHSSDIWRTLDDYALQQRIGHCFALRNRLNDFSVLLQQQKEAGAAFFNEKFFGDRKDFLAAIRELTGLPYGTISRHTRPMSRYWYSRCKTLGC